MTDCAHPEALVDSQWVEGHLNDPKVRTVEAHIDPAPYESVHIPGTVFWKSWLGPSLAARATASAQHEQRRLGCLVKHAEQRCGRTSEAAFALFPATDCVLRHVDAPGELVLGEAQALADTLIE